mmetsp:Transcript_24848/g.55222  ORF Transcript_24848/g.55222 Transcript_24848/m.55222 type:complete len:107 (-) Transcript_24848:86-406(-)|eukprot:CAMPEP_0170576502 /NCGR_PEP_ID=MMETSP0224-20130122/4428_1 /TAXON_ID=285029 /ORGANISM="Togula jolla, Strain CCCM 725" /LENGTH=106 /DNA_ID=CAMNT_0010899351 /DNA_START=124 /DNA_END=444 /DNA_ORIENTATION=+
MTQGAYDSSAGSSTATLLINCLFAVVFVGMAMGTLSKLGFVSCSNSCPSGDGYAWCGMARDARAIVSFVVGGLVCCLLTRSQEGQGPLFSNLDCDLRHVRLLASIA